MLFTGVEKKISDELEDEREDVKAALAEVWRGTAGKVEFNVLAEHIIKQRLLIEYMME